MVRQMSCILLINRNIQKINCDMTTAGFSTIRKIRLLFFLFVVKDGKLLRLWHAS